MSLFRYCLAAAALAATLFAHAADAAVDVFACEPEWAALAQEIGGDRVDVFAATTGKQDPHRVQARPSLIARMRQAELVVCTGAELEAGWLPLLLRQAANPKVQPGAPGYLEASRHVRMLEVPATLDRSLGDIHAAGNPHIQTDPRNFLPVGEALARQLAQIDPSGAPAYRARYTDFATRWREAIARWEGMAAPLHGVPVLVQHKSWVYLLDWLGMVEAAALEPKPGVEPSTAYLAELLQNVAAVRPRMTLVAAYQGDRPSRWVAERAGIPVVELPFTVGGTPEADTLPALFDQTVSRLLAALRSGS